MNKETIKPEVGMGATLCYPSDRYPYTIVSVSKSGYKIVIQADTAVVTKPMKQYGDPVEYRYERNPQGRMMSAFRNQRGVYKASGITVHIGDRRKYLAPEV